MIAGYGMFDFLDKIRIHAARSPTKTALSFGDSKVSYVSMETSSDEIARKVASLSNPNEPIGLLLTPGIELIVGLLGVLKAARPYVPLDPTQPVRHLQGIADDAGVRVILTTADQKKLTVSLSADAVDQLNEILISVRRFEVGNFVIPPGTCYVLYTSGTTGRPKGVVMPRASLSPLIDWQVGRSAALCGHAPTTLQFAPVGFDVSFQEIVSTLADGGTLVLLDEATRVDPKALCKLIVEATVNRAFLPPQVLYALAEAAKREAIPHLREINAAGERLRITPALAEFMNRHEHCRLVNQYGPTETHVVAAYQLPKSVCDFPILPPIGRALPWVNLKIVDEQRRPVAVGEVGEVLIGGQSLATGYLGQPQLTDQAFLREREGQERFYRSGDLARRLPNGDIEYVGRGDRQLKIRGVRVEPGHIESSIQQVEGVDECVVDAVEDPPGQQKLVACLVTGGGNKEDVSERVRRHLSASLPRQLIPSAIVDVEKIPLLTNGKIDRLALKNLTLVQRARARVRFHLSEPEQSIASIWQSVLHIADPNPEINFFDQGGHSLGLVQVKAALKEHLGVEVSIAELLAYPTIRSLARLISKSHPQVLNEVAKRGHGGSAIAIVGMSCRFPGAADTDAFWENLQSGRESLVRWTAPDGSLRAEGRLDGVDVFDAAFFGIPPAEAELLDPQHRLFMECAWAAFENAGYDPTRIKGRVGVFAGSGMATYLMNNLAGDASTPRNRTYLENMDDLRLMVANDRDYLPTRISYRFGFTGPAINVQTACSTSLVAVHLACQSLRSGECEMVLAGAVSISVPQGMGHSPDGGTVFSPTATCRPFDADADGAVFGNGVGTIVLKRLDDALADGDSILAVIKGSAVNNDGSTKVGFVAPSVAGQASVIRDALAMANVRPDEVSYVECHGTATSLGDAVEVTALAQVRAGANETCAVGSVKSNIGHLGWAAGVAGLIKTVLALKNEKIPATLHYRAPHPDIPLTQARLRVVDRLESWPRGGKPRYAGISAFGIGGTNAHLVLEEAPAATSRQTALHQTIALPLSAFSRTALGLLSQAHSAWLDENDVSPSDVAFTLSAGRRRMPWRLAVTGRSRQELAQSLRDATKLLPSEQTRTRKIGFAYPGHGCQARGMGWELFKISKPFRATLERCDAAFTAITQRSLIDILYSKSNTLKELASFELGQPALFSFQAALTEHWKSHGVSPDAVIGHSVGELSAALAAGVFTLEEGLRIVAERGRLIESLRHGKGATLAVACEKNAVLTIAQELGCDIEVAAENSPRSITLSGTVDSIELLKGRLDSSGIRNRRLAIGVAAHSAEMLKIRGPFVQALRHFSYSQPCIPLISNVTGEQLDVEGLTSEYWADQLRHTVRFSDGLKTMENLGIDTFLEVGPDATLFPLISECLPDAACLTSLKPGEEDAAFATCMAALHTIGVNVDVLHFDDAASHARLHLPTYPFQRQRYWVGSNPVANEDVPKGPIYQVCWQTSLLREAPVVDLAGHWLIVSETRSFPETLLEHMAGHGALCRRVETRDDATISIRSEDVASLSGIIFESGTPCDGEDRGVAVAEAIWRSCKALSSVVRAVAGTSVTIWVVTRTTNHPASGIFAGSLSGLSRVAAIEHPELQFRNVIIDEDDPVVQAEQLVLELRSKSNESLVRIGSSRDVARLQPVSTLDKGVPESPEVGTHIVAGGLGGLGLLVGEWLAARASGRIILAGRSNPDLAAQLAIEKLRSRGVDVIVCRADVNELDDVRRLVQFADTPSAPLRSVFHLAGLLSDGTVASFDERAKGVLRTKIAGALNLDYATRERGCLLERFVMFSSVVGTIGNAGQSSHAAANAALDAIAAVRQQEGLVASSIAWGAWADTGTLATMDNVKDRLTSLGFGFMHSEDSLTLLDQVLPIPGPATVCAPMDWARFLASTRQQSDPFFAIVRPNQQKIFATKQDFNALPQVPADHAAMRQFITLLAHRILPSRKRAGAEDDSFISLGMDSLTAIEMRNAIQERLRLRLPATLLFDFPTVELLSQHLVELVEARERTQLNNSPDTQLRRQISVQQRRWLRLLRGQYGKLLVPIVVEAPFDLTAFTKTLESLVERHEILRWKYKKDEAIVVHVSEVIADIEKLVIDMSDASVDAQRNILAKMSTDIRRNMPDPENGVPWMFRCLPISSDRFVILLGVQHLEFDGVSISLFVDELRSLYGAMTGHSSAELREAVPYSEYVAWQNHYVQNEIQEDRAFFQGLYANVEGPIALPLHDGFTPTKSFVSGRFTRTGPSGMMERLELRGNQLNVTPFALMATAYSRLIASLTSRSEALIGTIVAGRPNLRFRSVLGPCVAPFPVPVPVAGRSTAQIARCWNDLITSINARSAYPVADLTRHVKAFRGLPEETYFTDAFIMFNNYQRESEDLKPYAEVLECLAPIEDDLMSAIDDPHLPEVAGLFLIIDVWKNEPRFNFWHHIHRFSEKDVAVWSSQYLELLHLSLEERE